jgi:lipoprotein-anchoring transpeptidase ErfK/SrfK
MCNGPDATLDEAAKILLYARPGPKRGEPMPYAVAYVRDKVPYYYARLPEKKDRMRIEGGDVEGSIASAYVSPDPHLGLLGPPRELPQELLEGARIPRPLGAAPRLRYTFHTGRAEPRTRLALMSWFEHDKRRWTITSQLDLVAIDRLRIIDPPSFHGVEIAEDQSLPVGFVKHQSAVGQRFDEEGKAIETVRLTHRQGLHLTGEKKTHAGKTLLASHEGIWVQENVLTLVEPREIPSFVKNDTLRWLDISIHSQTLVAYRGKKPVYATLVSTGSGGMGDPETTHSTPRGLFAIFSKHVSTKMSGDELGAEYQIDDVPYVQYFHRGYALHAAFWHNNFGRVQSHGCVNLAPTDAAWVFEFTGPEVPEGWHGRYVKSGGTPVLIRP